jgi:hypothetical protein
MRVFQGVILAAILASMAAQAHAKKWQTIARGTTRWSDVESRVLLQRNGNDYRLVSRFGGGMVSLGLGVAYASPQTHVTTFRRLEEGVYVPARPNLWDSHLWLLRFDKGRPSAKHMASPNYSSGNTRDVKGAEAQRVLAAPVVREAKGSYGSRWELRVLDGGYYHVIHGKPGSGEKPSVIAYENHDIWLDRLKLD